MTQTNLFFSAMASSQSILLAGAGGGYDIYCGLPLYFSLLQQGKQVHLANLSFSTIYASNGKRIGPAMVEVTASTEAHLRYFPELHLAKWLQHHGYRTPIYCFDRTGAAPIHASYVELVDRLGIDTVILIDGGTDSLLCGDEEGLGTPEEDMASLAAVQQLPLAHKYLVALGFGIDAFHGVCHAHFLEAVAEISQAGGFLGAWSLHKEMPEVRRYMQCVEDISSKMFNHPSIVNTSIVNALAGHFGNYHASYRTEGSELFINPLMTLYWAFTVEGIVKRHRYLDRITPTQTLDELHEVIEHFRQENPPTKPWKPLPM